MAAGIDFRARAPRWSNLSRLVPRLLGTRLALTYSALALLVMAVLGWSLAETVHDFYLAQVRAELLEETAVVGDVVTPLLSEEADRSRLGSAVDRLGEALRARVTIVTMDGVVLADSDGEAAAMENHRGRPEIQDAIRAGAGSSIRPSTTLHQSFVFVARALAAEGVVVRLGIPLDVVDGIVRDTQRQVAVAALIAAVLMSAAGLFVAQRIGEPLEALRTQATSVAMGRLDVSVDPAPTRELGDLGRAFNAMTGRLRSTLAELERVRVRLEATLANLSDGVVITDERGYIVLANVAAREMVAADGADVGEPIIQFARDHELADMVHQVLATPRTTAERTVQHGRSGRTLEAAARSLDMAGERIGVVVLRDVTELRRLERMRREFVANVSHELRTPLASIRAMVETLEAGALDDPSVSSDFLARIISEVDRLALLVDDLLDLARLESGRTELSPESLDPASIVHHSARRLAPQIERSGLTVIVEVAPETPNVVADRARIEQVLLNLIDNAVKFTPAGGSVTVRAGPDADFVRFEVRDTGVGLAPEVMPRLFERFYKADRSRRSEGTGLGLAIAKHIVQAHGGSIWAEPNPGGGSAFIFRLPRGGPPRQKRAGDNLPANAGFEVGMGAASGGQSGGRARPADHHQED